MKTDFVTVFKNTVNGLRQLAWSLQDRADAFALTGNREMAEYLNEKVNEIHSHVLELDKAFCADIGNQVREGTDRLGKVAGAALGAIMTAGQPGVKRGDPSKEAIRILNEGGISL